MQVKAKLKNLRVSERKARLVADLIRGKSTDEAKNQLKFSLKKTADPLIKLVDSCIANGVNNFGLDKNNLFIEQIKVDKGRVLKRWRPRAHGRAYPIFKRSCHIELILNEVVKGKGQKEVKKQKPDNFVSYQQVKKAMKEADKMLAKKNKGKAKAKDKKTAQDSGSKLNSGKIKGAVNKFFRRKSM
ncbi:MAG: 50S ribosomal protein L22 [Candidatus Moranbacteria bacterium]|nr:50S ribosomal protein L22 [Candidatus Moranbacteria bacterium]